MKDLGRTPTGDWLVQMTSDEHAGLARLAAAMEGKVATDLPFAHPWPLDTDLVAMLRLLNRFAASRMLMNELLKAVQGVVHLLSPETDKEAV